MDIRKKPNIMQAIHGCSGALILLALVCSPAIKALGPLDGEIGVEWWNTHTSGNVLDGDLDVGSFSLRGETWLSDSWGLKGAFYSADIEEGRFQDEQRMSLDLKRRLISPTENSFIAAGIGWESIQLASGGSSNGVRLSLDGRVGLMGIVSMYGQAAWMPTLGDADGFSDLSGMEFETGVVLDPLPFFSVRAGFRKFNLDYNHGSGSGSSSTSGIILGTGFHW